MSPLNKEELLALFPNQDDLSVVMVPNARDNYPTEQKELEVKNCKAAFKKYGFKTSMLDLANANEQTVSQSLQGTKLVWVMGGNTFYLNYLVRKSGFDKVVRDLLGKGLVYGGESAGAVIVGSTLHGIEHLDDPKEAPEVVWEGMGLLNYGLIPH